MKGLKIGEFEELILLAVGILENEAYGLAIQKQLEINGRTVNLSAVHVALNRLEEKGYLRSQLGAPTQERGGKRKRLYELTPFGIKSIAALKKLRQQMWDKLPDHLAVKID